MKSVINRILDELEELRALHQIRTLRPKAGIDFCSNDYFLLSKNPHVKNAIKESLDEEGYGSSSSRFIRGECERYSAVQKRLAQFKKSDSALLFSSGYAANLGTLSSLIKKGDLVFSDQLNHASIIDGIRLSGASIRVFPHLDIDALANELKDAEKGIHKFLVTESLFSMDGDIAPLDKYAELAHAYDAALIVDEAHAVGLYGSCGSGLISQFGIDDEVLASINGLGKAFGCFGAFVAGSELLINFITQRARTLMFSTALPPLSVAAIGAALDIVIDGEDLRKKLFLNVATFSDTLASKNLNSIHHAASPIIPVIVGDNLKAIEIADRMQTFGFDVRAIRPPTVPKDSARLRITTNVDHSEELICAFVDHLRRLL